MTKKKTTSYVGPCEGCAKIFEVWTKKRFCSDECRLAAWKRARRIAPANTPDVKAMVASGYAKHVPEYPRYVVSKDGRVFSSVKTFWREMNPSKTGSGKKYRTVYLGAGNRWDVHRLVAHVWVGPCPKGMLVRHLDGDPSNNHYENLAYGTYKDNMADAIRHKTTCKGKRNARAVLDEVCVRAIRNIYQTEMFTQRDIAKLFEVSGEAVHQVVHGKRWGWLDEPKRSEG